MRKKFKIFEEEIRSSYGFYCHNIFIDKLSKDIDTDFFDIKIIAVTKELSPNIESTIYYVDYKLIRKPIWGDLEETEERMKIGI